jgi:hypothetical protein
MSSEYSEKLKDPRWQRMRLEVFQRDGFRCVACDDSKTTLHVHHLIYSKGEPWDSPMETLETLCEDCHDLREDFNDLFSKRTVLPTRFIRTFFNFHNRLVNLIEQKHGKTKDRDWGRWLDKVWNYSLDQKSPTVTQSLPEQCR